MKTITKGVIVRKIKSSGAFNGEDVDIHGRLEDASIDARQGVMDYRVIVAEMDRGNYPQYAFCDVSKIIKGGGQVFVNPVPGNRNHCVIKGLTIKKANNLFSNHINWPGAQELEMVKMNTYRVYIARPLTPQGIWNWSDTILDYSSQQALSSSYQKWVATNPKIPVPPLHECRSNVYMINKVQEGAELHSMALQAPNSDATASQKAFMDEIKSEVNKILSTELDGTFETVNYPAGFNYGITYGNNGNYNKATLQDIDTMLSTSQTGLPILNGSSFSNYYAQLIPNIIFKFSQADQQTMQNEDTAASGQINSILTEFSNAGGKFSDPSPLGGKLQDVFNQLTKEFGGLDNIPDSMNALRNAIASYKAIAADSYALHNKFFHATARLAAMQKNITHPSAKNGGMEVDTGTYFVGYTPDKLPTANQLIGGLSTDSNAIEVDLNLDNFSSTKSDLSINGKVGFTIPIADILDIGVSASSSYNLSKYASASTKMSMNIKYKGVTHFASMPSVLSTDLSQGWYALDILQAIVNNAGKDATGYQLTGSEYDVSDIFGLGKVFSRLKTFVISQQPEVQITISGSKASQIKSDLKVGAKVDVKLFGLFDVGSVSSNYSISKVDDKSVSGSVVVTFGPPNVSGTTPIQNQIAYVLGGVATYPPNDI